MYILIDCTNYAAIARHKDYRALAALAYIQYANLDTAIFPEDNERGFVRFDMLQLQSILSSVSEEDSQRLDYNQLRSRLLEAVTSSTDLVLEADVFALEGQAQLIDYADDKAYRFNANGARPLPVREWVRDPQVNRARLARPSAVQMRPQGPAPAPLPAPPPAGAVRVAAPAPAPRRAAPSAPVVRPKGGATGKVWDIADRCCGGTPRADKAMRKTIVDACKEEGINETTAGVQYSKWKKFHNL